MTLIINIALHRGVVGLRVQGWHLLHTTEKSGVLVGATCYGTLSGDFVPKRSIIVDRHMRGSRLFFRETSANMSKFHARGITPPFFVWC
jgi:hypothetical protein